MSANPRPKKPAGWYSKAAKEERRRVTEMRRRDRAVDQAAAERARQARRKASDREKGIADALGARVQRKAAEGRPEAEKRHADYRRQAKALRRDLREVKANGEGPTPHTARQHRKTSFERMIESRAITPEMFEAAQEIERVYLAITGAVLVRSQSYERQDRSVGAQLAERTAVAYQLRYKPWADELSRRQKGCAWPMLEVVIDIVVDGRPLDTLDHERGWRKGISKFIVQWALLQYAEIAGWARRGSLRELESSHGIKRAPKAFLRAA